MKTNVHDSEFLLDLGFHIKKLRQNKGLSQQTLADHIGVKKSTITRLEQGQTNASICLLKAISKGLDMDLSVLLKF
jgi:transcriptional regulator with XRE-family HTH domain